MSARNQIKGFNFRPGRLLARKYEVIDSLGAGWEGEVYLVRECATGIERAVKFFFPQRNPDNRTLTFYARKLHKLRHCPILIQYLTQETITFKRQKVTFLVSDYVEGERLSDYLLHHPRKRLDVFQALHLLHTLAAGVERIHHLREYHGDLHTDNIIVRRHGLGFDLKLVDMFHWGAPKRVNIEGDVCDLIRIFYDLLGGQRFYAKQPPEVKAICRGLKRTLILRKFRTAGQLREYLETMKWSD